jgi:hypothetical protein
MSDPENGMADLVPKTDDHYAGVLDFLLANQTRWQDQLNSGLTGLVGHLDAAGYLPLLAPKNPEFAAGHGSLSPDSAVLVSARVKKPEAIIAKMRRFGEPLRVMLDRWGYRVVVTNETTLGAVADSCAELWETPTPAELLLRNGELQFTPRRDYRRRDHAGLSAATTNNYDQAVHLNRKTPFGIVEIQVMTYDLYRRVHCDPASADSHDAFVARREQLLRDRMQ